MCTTLVNMQTKGQLIHTMTLFRLGVSECIHNSIQVSRKRRGISQKMLESRKTSKTYEPVASRSGFSANWEIYKQKRNMVLDGAGDPLTTPKHWRLSYVVVLIGESHQKARFNLNTYRLTYLHILSWLS